MSKAERILMLHMNSDRMAAHGKEVTDLEYFKLWKRIYPDTYRHIIEAMEDYKNDVLPDFGRDPKKKY